MQTFRLCEFKVPRLVYPCDQLFICPLGHPLLFLTTAPQEYHHGGLICDKCNRHVNRSDCRFGLYHCSEPTCRAAYPATGWDMCADCAVRHMLTARNPPMSVQTAGDATDRPLSNDCSPSTSTALSMPPTQALAVRVKWDISSGVSKLPTELLFECLSYLPLQTLMLTARVCRSLTHQTGAFCDQALKSSSSTLCGICTKRCDHEDHVCVCSRCGRCFHDGCLLQSPDAEGVGNTDGSDHDSAHDNISTTEPLSYCPCCPSTIQPGHQLCYATRDCFSCGLTHHMAELVPRFPIQVTDAGITEVNGLYLPIEVTSLGIAIYQKLRTDASTTQLPVLLRTKASSNLFSPAAMFGWSLAIPRDDVREEVELYSLERNGLELPLGPQAWSAREPEKTHSPPILRTICSPSDLENALTSCPPKWQNPLKHLFQSPWFRKPNKQSSDTTRKRDEK